MMLRPTLLALAFLALPAAAGPEAAGGRIRDEEFRAQLEELLDRQQAVAKGELKPAQLEQYYVLKVEQAKTPREKAIAHLLLGHAIQIAGSHRRKESRQEFQRALAAWPDFPGAHVRLAALALAAKDYTLAKTHARKALALDAEYIPAIHLLGAIALVQGEPQRARRYFEQAIDIEPSFDGCQGLAKACIQLCRESYLEEEKEDYTARAIAAADGLVALHPESGRAHLFRAEVLMRLERTEEAILALESSYEELRDERFRRACLANLHRLYTQQRRVDKVKETLDRLLESEDLDGNLRAELERERRLLDEVGAPGFLILQIQRYLKLVANDGVSPDDRRRAMRLVLDFFTDPRVAEDKDFESIRKEIHKTCFSTLKEQPPPELLLEMMRFFRRAFRHPPLIRILVFYVYPYGEKDRTPQVRAEAVRTIAALGGVAAIPTLLYCLEDEDGGVARECDKALSDAFGVRSRAGGDGVEPLDEPQRARALRGWRRYALTEEGAQKLVEAVAALREIVGTDPQQNRELRINPIANHIANVILLDDGMRWEAWKAAYEFLVDFMGREFRPPDQRATPVTPEQRLAVVRALREFWDGEPDTRLEEDEQGGRAQESPEAKKNPK